MASADLSQVLKIFGGKELSADEQGELFKEVALMTLARASNADSNIDPVEVETVQRIVKDITGEDVRPADIRVAARSGLYEKAPLSKYLASAAKKLPLPDRVTVVKGLAEVIRSDVRVSVREVDFFDMVCDSLQVDPAALIGLIPE